MYEGEKLEAALQHYTIDALFALYKNMLKFESKIQIQATVGVVLDNNKQNTQVITFNLERNKENDGLVECMFEEETAKGIGCGGTRNESPHVNTEKRSSTSFPVAFTHLLGDGIQHTVSLDEDECENQDMSPLHCMESAVVNRTEPRQEEYGPTGNTSNAGIPGDVNQHQESEECKTKECTGCENGNYYRANGLNKNSTPTVSTLVKKSRDIARGTNQASRNSPTRRSDNKNKNPEQTRSVHFRINQTEVTTEHAVSNDILRHKVNPKSDVCDINNVSSVPVSSGVVKNENSDEDDLDLMLSPFKQSTSPNSAPSTDAWLNKTTMEQSKAVSSSEYSGSFDIENLLDTPRILKLKTTETEESDSEEDDGEILTNRNDRDMVEDKLLDESSESSRDFGKVDNQNIASTSGYRPFQPLLADAADSSNDFEDQMPSQTPSTSKIKRNEQKLTSVADVAEHSGFGGDMDSSPDPTVVQGVSGDSNQNQVSTSGQNSGIIESNFLQISADKKKDFQVADRISLNLSNKKSKPEKGGGTPRKRRMPCGQCKPCKRIENCVKCKSCLNKNLKQICQKRKCELLQQSASKARKPPDPKQRRLVNLVKMTTNSSDDEAKPREDVPKITFKKQLPF